MKKYYHLIKPGIVRGNAITGIAGFLLAARGTFDTLTFIGMLLGLSGVIASACVYNNILDRNIDRKMKRTKERSLVTGEISVSNALLFASILFFIGFGLLLWLTNLLATLSAFVGFVAYVGLYGYTKRKSPLSTLVGTVSGSTPIVIGYVAASGSFDPTALLLFAVMVYWQLAHFYAVALYRQKEYENANIQLWPTKYGRPATTTQIKMSGVFFLLSTLLIGNVADLSPLYFVVITLVNIWWIMTMFRSNFHYSLDKWAKKIFAQSLVVLLIWSVLLSVDYWLP